MSEIAPICEVCDHRHNPGECDYPNCCRAHLTDHIQDLSPGYKAALSKWMSANAHTCMGRIVMVLINEIKRLRERLGDHIKYCEELREENASLRNKALAYDMSRQYLQQRAQEDQWVDEHH